MERQKLVREERADIADKFVERLLKGRLADVS